MPETLFTDSEIPTAPKLGPAATRERIVAVMLTQNIYGMTGNKLTAFDLGLITDLVLDTLPSAGLEISDRGRVAGFKACLSDWVRDYTEGCDNGGNPTETDFEDLVARTRRLIGGKS